MPNQWTNRFTPTKQQAYLTLLRKDYGQVAAAEEVGVRYQAVYEERQRNAEFQELERDALAVRDDRRSMRVEEALYAQALKSFTAMKWWLINRHGQRWRDKTDDDQAALTADMIRRIWNDGFAAARASAVPHVQGESLDGDGQGAPDGGDHGQGGPGAAAGDGHDDHHEPVQ